MARSSESTERPEPFWGLDIGGTSAVLGRMDDSGGFTVETSLETVPDQPPRELLQRCGELILDRCASPTAVGIGVAGLVDFERGVVLKAPNLPPWEGFDALSCARELFGCPVIVDNDCNVFAAGAVATSEVPSTGLWLVITLGTGIGGAIVLDGEIVRGRGQAGEVGHMTVNPQGPSCPCGSSGCWETFAGKAALLRYYSSERGGSADQRLEPREIAELARRGDGPASRALATFGTWIGLGLANLDNCLFPEGIAMGGGLSGSFDLIEPHARAEFLRRAMLPRWNVHRLSDTTATGALGAACLAKRLSGKPPGSSPPGPRWSRS